MKVDLIISSLVGQNEKKIISNESSGKIIMRIELSLESFSYQLIVLQQIKQIFTVITRIINIDTR